MSIEVISILILSGLFVGFINTLAGGGTIISITVLTWLGLPFSVANGTNRIAVTLQNLVAVNSFNRQGIMNWRKSLRMAIPTVAGSILGAFIAVKIDAEIIEKAFAMIMLIMLFFIFYKPSLWLKGNPELFQQPVRWWNYPLFFIIGIYGGFLHVGVGYYLLAAIVLGLGFDLVKGNAVKNLLVLLYVPCTLIIFILNGDVFWEYGLIHSIGNIIGALIAAKMAVKRGADFIRWVMVVIILVAVADIFGLIQIKEWFSQFVQS